MNKLLESIRYNNGTFPRNELQQIIDRKEEAIPFLIQIVEEIKDNPKMFIEGQTRFDHIYAMYLLAQFRVKELYPLLIEILSLPDELPHDIFGDTVTEGMGRILASVCGGDIIPIQCLIENSQVDEYVRGQGLHSLVVLVLNEQLERSAVMEYFGQLLGGKLSDINGTVNAELVCSCDDLYPKELYEDIVALYGNDKIDDSIVNLADIDFTLKRTKESHLAYKKQDHQFQFINDTISEIEWWNCFHQNKAKKKFGSHVKQRKQEPNKVQKIGRNEPCPCGSGQKYKKCCGK